MRCFRLLTQTEQSALNAHLRGPESRILQTRCGICDIAGDYTAHLEMSACVSMCFKSAGTLMVALISWGAAFTPMVTTPCNNASVQMWS